MKTYTVTSTASSPALSPFLPGYNAAVVLYGAGVLSGSADGTTYTALVTGTVSDLTVATITIPKYLKTDTGSAYLLGDV